MQRPVLSFLTFAIACTSVGLAVRGWSAAIGAVASSSETVLYSFTDNNGDGSLPRGGLVGDGAGAFYGATSGGGLDGVGTVFRLAPSASGYTETILYFFRLSGGDGDNPIGPPVEDSSGALYGTTGTGGAFRDGTVYKLTPTSSGYRESIIHSFHGPRDGSFPSGPLIIDASGALYGTTQAGGGTPGCGLGGCGTVFKLVPNGSTYTEVIVHHFHGTDGSNPLARLLADGSGNVYGITEAGGGTSCSFYTLNGCGVAYRVAADGSGFKVLYRFQGGSDGSFPLGALIADSKGVLYGTSEGGGLSTCPSSIRPAGCGTVFRLAPVHGAYKESVIYRFRGRVTGERPGSALILGPNGTLYGATTSGGEAGNGGNGTLYVLSPSGSGYQQHVVYYFEGSPSDGAYPMTDLVYGVDGALYGTTEDGGTADVGTVFRFVP